MKCSHNIHTSDQCYCSFLLYWVNQHNTNTFLYPLKEFSTVRLLYDKILHIFFLFEFIENHKIGQNCVLEQYFGEQPLIAITAFFNFGSFRLDTEHLSTGFKSCHTFTVGFSTRLWLGHSKTSKVHGYKLLYLWLDVLGRCPVLKGKISSVVSGFAAAKWVFFQDCYIFISYIFPVPAKQNHSKALCCHHHDSS